ncbi:MAG: hydrolase [Thiomargarita sp.]|nr:hydrolase [Thiomargarita sp.]
MTLKNIKIRLFRQFVVLIFFISLLSGCEEGDGTGIILAGIAVGAAAGLQNVIADDGDGESSTSTETEGEAEETIDEPESLIEIEDDDETTEVLEPLKVKMLKYDGINDDLLTAGLGQKGLMEEAPAAVDLINPTVAEIRKATIVNQYQASQNMRISAGYGELYGSAVPTPFATPSNNGKVKGKEYIAYARGKKNVTMMVQLPDSFDPENPCIVAAPSPGSRGVYGAIGTAGEWGVKNHCAVAYTDKGTGNGVHDLNTNTVNLIDGTRATTAGNFKAEGTSEMDLAAYNSTYPFRIAQKHAHSQQNPEVHWGTNVLDAIAFAFEVLNMEDNFGQKDKEGTLEPTLTSDNTIVIASSVSSGGAASLRATEQDSEDLIDGVVVAAPMINPKPFSDGEGVTIEQGDKTFPYKKLDQKSLFDVLTYYNVFQPCANGNIEMLGRCTALKNKGWLSSSTRAEQIAEAQALLNNYGTLASSNTHNYEDYYAGFAYLYANAYGRFSVVKNLCGYSYAATIEDNPPSAKMLSDLADDFQSSNGMPPSSGTYLINNHGNNEEGINFSHSVDINGNLDGYLEGALCLRRLATGTTGVTINTGNPLTGTELRDYQLVQEGIKSVLAHGNLQGKPAIIVHGRDDAVAHVNFTSRLYYGLTNKTNKNNNLVYIEVKNAGHFDNFNEDDNVPLHYYFSQAMDRMYDHLKNEVDLPESQVIPTLPTATNLETRLPKIDSDEVCPITFSKDVLTIPEC